MEIHWGNWYMVCLHFDDDVDENGGHRNEEQSQPKDEGRENDLIHANENGRYRNCGPDIAVRG